MKAAIEYDLINEDDEIIFYEIAPFVFCYKLKNEEKYLYQKNGEPCLTYGVLLLTKVLKQKKKGYWLGYGFGFGPKPSLDDLKLTKNSIFES